MAVAVAMAVAMAMAHEFTVPLSLLWLDGTIRVRVTAILCTPLFGSSPLPGRTMGGQTDDGRPAGQQGQHATCQRQDAPLGTVRH
jgi:hypothetical protein